MPCDELKAVQALILHRFLREIPVHLVRESNRAGTSIVTNATAHASARAVFSLDLVDAFPSVWRSRVRAVLSGPLHGTIERQFPGETFTDEDLGKLLESMLDLLMLNDRLPQGPPSSPRILDLCLFSADTQLFQLIRASSSALQKYRLTGYADDYTISSDQEIPETMRGAIVEILTTLGWRVHTSEAKTHYMSPAVGEVPVVTGLVISPDGRITMAPRKVNQIRARLYQLLKLPEWDVELRGEAAGLSGYVQSIYGEKPPSELRVYVEQTRNRMTRAVVDFVVPPDPAEPPLPSPRRRGRAREPRTAPSSGRCRRNQQRR